MTFSINFCSLNRGEKFVGGSKMCSRYQKLKVGIICLVAMSFGWESRAQDLTTRVTGCLASNGNVGLLAPGDDPLQNCPDDEDQISLKLDDLGDGAATVPFFVTLLFGEERIIAENGALELRARCILGSGTSGDSLELVVTSTLDGWLVTSVGSSTTTTNLAGDEVVLFTAVGQPDQGRLSGFGDQRLTGAQLALAPDGSFLALALGSSALGVDLFNQDCIAVGTASLIRGDLPPSGLGRQVQQPDTILGMAGSSGISIVARTGSSGSGTSPISRITGLNGARTSGMVGAGISGIGGARLEP